MIQKPEENVAEYLAAQGVVIYDNDHSNMFVGPMRPPKTVNGVTLIPEQSAWILKTTGPEPDKVFGHDYRVHETPIQIMVRGQPNQYINTRDWAQEIWDKLEGAAIENYMTCLSPQEGPVWLNYDENSRPIFSLNFILRFQVNAND